MYFFMCQYHDCGLNCYVVTCDWWAQKRRRLALLEFDRVRKSMGVIVQTIDGHNKLLVKVTLYMNPQGLQCL